MLHTKQSQTKREDISFKDLCLLARGGVTLSDSAADFRYWPFAPYFTTA
jgi:hypothetical protein